MITSKEIKEQLSLLPKEPGVYFMYNHEGQIIYIGKAQILYKRVKQYFTNHLSNSHYASHLMQGKITKIDWIVTNTEQEALLLEANLVKQHQPRYNVMLKDDKHYPYLRISISEAYPRVYITRRIEPKTKDLFFGPYPYSGILRKTLETVFKLFRIRDCDFVLPSKRKIQPCLSYHINRCDAPCDNLITLENYSKLVSDTILFLEGKNKVLIQKLTDKMVSFSNHKKYELAAQIRNQIKNLEDLTQHHKIDVSSNHTSQDFIAIAVKNQSAIAIVLQLRDGIITNKNKFEISCPLKEPLEVIYKHFLMQHYNLKENIPSKIFLPFQPKDINEIKNILTHINKKSIHILTPQKGDKKKKIDLAVKNAFLLLEEKEIKELSKKLHSESLLGLQKKLNLPFPPYHIEAFDISHLSGTNTVASMVCFKNGLPKKSEYRRFKIKTVNQINDFASMYEVVYRRVSRLKKENKSFPDLILIDGGKGQLSSSYQALKDLKCIHIPIVSLAKRLEKVFFPHKFEPLVLKHHSSELQLLQHLRDESHRFAITFQRSKRKPTVSKTSLHSISGLGKDSIQKVLKFYKYPENVWKHNWEHWKENLGTRIANILKNYQGTILTENQNEHS